MMRRVVLLLFIMVSLSLVGCSRDDPPPAQQVEEPIAEAIPDTATPVPTVSASSTATPTPTVPPATPTVPTTSPTATSQIYVVEQYDTLLGIALEYGVSVETLAAANGIDEEDFLQLGQEIVIPTSTPLASPTPTNPATATAPATTQVRAVTPTATAIGAAGPAGSSVPTAQTQTEAVEKSAGASSPASPPPAVAAPAGTPLPEASRGANINPLTGLPVADPTVLQRRPLLVRIGNDVGARQSQVGFNSADIVYEEIAEWWVTRFTAIFLANTPNTVGPVRSARLINVQLAPQYQGALAHSGGSDPVRWEISQAPIANLDEFYTPSPYFYRPNQGWQTRLAIDAQAARDFMASAGLEAPVVQQGFLFSDTIDRGEPAENIFIPYPRATSFTRWRYDPGRGTYLRFINDAPLTDVSSGQVTADNVIVYFAQHQPTDIVEDANGATSIRIIVNGQGPAWFFRDGKLNKGSWATDGTRTPYFAYQDGPPYRLKPGNTWIQVVPTYFKIGLNSPDEASSRP